MELWDLYTESRTPTGRTHIRGERIPEGLFHLVVHVWIRNSRGQYLISQRSASRPTFPLRWECVGGSVLAGETSLEGAIRETMEEVGIRLKPGDGQVLFSMVRSVIDGKPFQDIADVWLFSYDGQADLSAAATDEVAQTRWLTRQEIEALDKTGELVENLRYFFSQAELFTNTR